MAHWRDFLDPAAPRGDYLPWKVVAKRTSLSRTTAWRLQRRDEFPRPYAISPGRVGHLECEVEAWMASRAARSHGPRGGEAGADRRAVAAGVCGRLAGSPPTDSPVSPPAAAAAAGLRARSAKPLPPARRRPIPKDKGRQQLSLDL